MCVCVCVCVLCVCVVCVCVVCVCVCVWCVCVSSGSGEIVEACSVVLTTGTFLRGVINIGRL